MLEFLKGFKTLLFNVVAAVPVGVSLLMQLVQDPSVAPLIPPAAMPYITAGILIGNIILRFKTTTPVGVK